MKLVVKIILLVALVAIGMFAGSMSPVITNDLAMTQLENSDALLVATNTYNQIKPVIDILWTGLIIVVAGWIAYDVYKLFKIEKEK